MALICPNCKKKIDLKAAVSEFMESPEWSFWGEKGRRWIVCRGKQKKFDFVHFRVEEKSGKSYQRMAIVTGKEYIKDDLIDS